MELSEAMAALEAAGTEQNRKTYRNHGVKGEQFGVSFAFLDKLAKQIKRDHGLALALWETGNHDARLLATRIADPTRMDAAALEAWADNLDNYIITDAFSAFVARSPLAQEKMAAWTRSDDEWIGATGWNILAHMAMEDRTLPDDYFQPYLAEIQHNIHTRKNRVRYAMNNAMIAIGIRDQALREAAVEVALAVGPVDVDHLQTNCKTPEAASYIGKTWEHRAKKASKAV